MKRKRMISAALVVFMLLVFVAAGGGMGYPGGPDMRADAEVLEGQLFIADGLSGGKPADDERTEAADTDIEIEAEAADMQTEDGDTADIVARILALGTKEFFEGYPADEAFVCWVGGSFGMDVLQELAGQLSEGGADAGLWYEQTGRTMHVLWLEYCRAHGYASYICENVVWQENSDDSCIKIDFIGDINFDESWYTMQAAQEAGGVEACISADIQEELQSADITVVNNEFAYTTSDEAAEGKDYTFKTNPDNVSLLEIFGTDIVSLANNHTYDYGKQGLLDTLDTLEKAGYPYSGAGRNLAEASAVHYFVAGGRKIAIVCASEIEKFSNYTKKATEDTPGILRTQQEEAVLAAIRTARQYSDYVIAYIHWGTEGEIAYGSGQKGLAQTYVEAGADAVIGGHPHRLQGVSFIDGAPVAYSLGNFWFSTGTLYTTIAQIQIDESGELSLVMLPCIQQNLTTTLLTDEEEIKDFYHYLADISKDVGIDEDGTIHAYKDVDQPGESPYAYTSGRKYGLHQSNVDLEGRAIDIVGNLE